VLKHRYPEQFSRLLQPVRYLSILRGRCRVPARVVVRDDDRDGVVHYRGGEDVAGMY